VVAARVYKRNENANERGEGFKEQKRINKAAKDTNTARVPQQQEETNCYTNGNIVRDRFTKEKGKFFSAIPR